MAAQIVDALAILLIVLELGRTSRSVSAGPPQRHWQPEPDARLRPEQPGSWARPPPPA